MVAIRPIRAATAAAHPGSLRAASRNLRGACGGLRAYPKAIDIIFLIDMETAHLKSPLGMAAVALVLTLGLSACGGASAGADRPACLQGPATYLSALRKAPYKVRLNDELPISECLAKSRREGGLTKIGAAITAAAEKLRVEGAEDPRGKAPLRYGFLLGAAWRGGEARPQGIPENLLHRLGRAALRLPDGRPVPLSFSLSYGRGFYAGFNHG